MSIFRTLLILLLLGLAYLLFWPLPIQPVAWTPPPSPAGEGGPYAYNDKLRSIQRIIDGVGHGPEGVALDGEGNVYAGFEDGRIIALTKQADSCRVLANSGGRPLGLALDADGKIFIADARKGLLDLDGNAARTLSTEADGVALGFTDDLDIARSDGSIYFSDASLKNGYGRHMDDIIEHGANGRLLRLDRASGKTTTLLRDLHFANGVALGPDEAYLLVNETSEYMITRYWLKGDKAGTAEPFVENLPGFPDNVSFNGTDRFWVALYGPRDPLLDRLLPGTFLRKIVARLPAFAQPKPKKHAWVLAFDLDGKLVANLQYSGPDAYAPITSVEEHDGWLWFGSLSDTAIGRMRLEDAMKPGPGAAPSAALAIPCISRPG